MTDEFATQLHQPRKPAQPMQPPKKKGFNKLLLLIPVVILLFIILAVVAFFVAKKYLPLGGEDQPQTETVIQGDLTIQQALNELSGLHLPLTTIQEIERNVIHTGSRDDEEALTRRLIALKHLYTNEFMRDNHSVQNLRNIYMLYSTDFSADQQSTLRWFINLPAEQRSQWEYVQGGVQDFRDFRQKVEAEMNRGQ